MNDCCAECGFTYGTTARVELPARLRAFAAPYRRQLARAIDGLRRRPAADVWSPLEYACHVRDVFTLYEERLALMLREDGPQYANWDQDASAIAERYAEQDATIVAG